MRLTNFILLCIVLTLTTFLNVSKAETCTTNDFGDRTCTTSTAGTITGNILTNSTFGTGTNTSTTGWSTDGDEGIHTHGVGDFGQKYNGYVDQGGTLAFHGHEDDNVYQDVDLVGDGHLTQSQINEGFTSTMSADVWFWNNVENTLTLKQTITTPDGTVTTQTRNINDDGGNRTWNTGSYVNYTDSYTHNSNTETDFTIRAEVYNNTAGTSYDSGHWGPDVDNVQLSITTAGSVTQGTSSSVFTPCFELNTCTYDNEAVDDAVNLIGEDGKPIGEFIENKVENIKPEDFNTEEFKVETFVMVPTDFKEEEFEEVKLEEFVKVEFEKFVSENNLQDTFETALVEEDITREEFYDAMSDTLKEEAFDDIRPQSQTEEIKEEKTELIEQDELKEGDVNATSTTIRTTEKPTTTESDEVAQGNEEEIEAGPQNETVSAEREVGNEKETEGQAKTEDTGETVETETNVVVKDRKVDTAEVSGIAEKVARVIKKLEAKLKRVDDRLKATSYVLAVGLQSTQPDMTAYTNKRIYGNQNIVGIPNPDFFQDINILQQEQIYRNVSLSKYTDNDPITVRRNALIEIDMKKQKLMAEIAALRSN